MAALPYLKAVWQQNRLLPVLIGILLAVNLVVFFAADYYLAPRASALEHRLLERQGQLRRQQQSGNPEMSLRSGYRQGREDLERFHEAIPEKTRFTRLIGDLFGMARTAGLEIRQIDYSPKVIEESRLLSYTLVFSVGGSYEQVKKFIFALESSPRVIALDELSLNRDEAAQGAVTMRLRFTTYFQAGRA